VLRIHTDTSVMDCIGPSFPGKFKWLRGVEVPPDSDHPSGLCLALPCNATAILKINPATSHVTVFGEEVLGAVLSQSTTTKGWYYHGGNLAPNGWIYAIPANANRVVKFHPASEQVVAIGPSWEGPQKWYGGIIGSDGCIYGIPHCHSAVLRIDPRTDDIQLLHHESGSPLSAGHWKWHGGLRAGHKIYGFPNNADQILMIDCASLERPRVYLVGDTQILQSGRHRIPQDHCYKYLGGALDPTGQFAYLFPCDAERVLRINTKTDELTLVGPLLLDGANKFQNGFASAIDGALYGIPQRSTGVLRIVPDYQSGNDQVDIVDCGEALVGVKDKFEGGVMGLDGRIYCMPLRSKC
jgi:hypothetical protein